MSRTKKPAAASASPQTEPVPWMISCPGGERTELLIPASAVGAFLQAAAVSNRAIATLQRHEASRRTTRRPSIARFERGLLLLAWIDSPHIGAGKLTKELVTDIKDHCKDWPCVRDYQKHGSREKLRNALRNLAEDTRRALRDRRLPAGWVQG
jgi:hypothetical protein